MLVPTWRQFKGPLCLLAGVFSQYQSVPQSPRNEKVQDLLLLFALFFRDKLTLCDVTKGTYTSATSLVCSYPRTNSQFRVKCRLVIVVSQEATSLQKAVNTRLNLLIINVVQDETTGLIMGSRHWVLESP